MQLSSPRLSRRYLHNLRSKLFIPTLRETPADAAIPSHQLLLRAGYIRQVSSGIYALLPLGVRTLSRLEGLIDKEMEAIGAQKTIMPHVLTKNLWEKTGRWDSAGPELFRLKDRHDANFCLAPTHEEAFTELVENTVHSYTNLPLRLYQMNKKFRDEIRPRFGLIRAKEFVMKDAYAFDLDEQAAQDTYREFIEAYHKILSKLKVPFVQVEADTGNIGGSMSHEFQLLTTHGEDTIISCSNCSYAANIESAKGLIPDLDDISSHHNSTESEGDFDASFPGLKSITYDNNKLKQRIVVLLPREADTVNEVALEKVLDTTAGWSSSDLSSYHESSEYHDKFSKVLVIVDKHLEYLKPSLAEWYTKRTQLEAITVVCDSVRCATSGDVCAACNTGTLEVSKGIEVGHAFFLGKKYSKAFNATALDSKSKAKVLEMGCYGLGVTRLLQGIVESHCDDKGIRWPDSNMAPYQVIVIPIGNRKGDDICSITAIKLATVLDSKFFSGQVVLDDRKKESPGSKMAEAELIGFPYVIVVGRSMKNDGTVEIQNRLASSREYVHIDAVDQYFADTAAVTNDD